MTMYWGGLFLVVFAAVAVILVDSITIVVAAAIVGLVVGHWLDPLTRTGPNSLKTNHDDA